MERLHVTSRRDRRLQRREFLTNKQVREILTVCADAERCCLVNYVPLYNAIDHLVERYGVSRSTIAFIRLESDKLTP